MTQDTSRTKMPTRKVWGSFPSTTLLPNTAAGPDGPDLQVGDQASVGGVIYVCGDATPNAALWYPQPNEGDLRWDDLRFPATLINPTGPVNPPDRSAVNGTLLFDDAAIEICAIIGQMPHSWAQGTGITPHIHWIQADSGDVKWRFEYVIKNNNTEAPTFPDDYTALDVTSTVFPYTSGSLMQITSFGEIDMAGFDDSCVLFMRLSRLANDVADTYSGDAALVEFDIHYRVNSHGSINEFGDSA